MPSDRPHIAALHEGSLFQSDGKAETVIRYILAIVKQLRQLFLIKPREQWIKIHPLQSLDLHAQELFIPSRIHRHAVVCDDVGFLLGLGEVIGKHTRHLWDTFFLSSGDSSVTGNHTVITVDDDGIDEAKLP